MNMHFTRNNSHSEQRQPTGRTNRTPPPRWVSAQSSNVWGSAQWQSWWHSQNLHTKRSNTAEQFASKVCRSSVVTKETKHCSKCTNLQCPWCCSVLLQCHVLFPPFDDVSWKPELQELVQGLVLCVGCRLVSIMLKYYSILEFFHAIAIMLMLCLFHDWENTSNSKRDKHPSHWHCLSPLFIPAAITDGQDVTVLMLVVASLSSVGWFRLIYLQPCDDLCMHLAIFPA